jgi:hypothetical protein
MTRIFSRGQMLRMATLGVFAAAVAASAPAARADEGVKLFKIVSARDEIIVGVTDKDLAGAEGSDLARLLSKMRAAGQIEVWRYAVRKADNGDLQQKASNRAMIIYSETLRVEPYVSPLKVLPPG